MKPVMTLEAAAYHKLKKIKAELDNQNSLIFQAEQQRGSLEIGIKAWSYMEIKKTYLFQCYIYEIKGGFR